MMAESLADAMRDQRLLLAHIGAYQQNRLQPLDRWQALSQPGHQRCGILIGEIGLSQAMIYIVTAQLAAQ